MLPIPNNSFPRKKGATKSTAPECQIECRARMLPAIHSRFCDRSTNAWPLLQSGPVS